MVSPTFKKATDTAAGTSAQYGAPDLKYAFDVLDGTHATDRVQAANIENAVTTNTAQTITGVKSFDDLTFRIEAGASNFYYRFNASNTTPGADRDIVIGPFTADDNMAVTNAAQTFQNKTITNKTGNVVQIGALQNPYFNGGRVAGGYMGGSSTTGQGVFAAAVSSIGTPLRVLDDTGNYLNWTSGALIDDDAGIRGTGSQAVHSRRSLRPLFTVKFRLNTITAVRMFIGFQAASGSFRTSDDPFNALEGFCIGMRSTDSAFQVIRNDATGATVFSTTGVTIDTNPHTIRLEVDSANTGFSWAMDGGALSSVITTDIPASTTALYPLVQIETSEAATKNFDVYYYWLEYNT